MVALRPTEAAEEAVPESDSAALVQAASLEIFAAAGETMRRAGTRDRRLGAEAVAAAVRGTVAAWAMAVDGDDRLLTAVAEPSAAHWLLYPVREAWRVAPGPRVIHIEVRALEADARPPRLRASFQFAGHRRFTDPAKGAGSDDETHGETLFVGLMELTLRDVGPRPWKLASGHVRTLDQYLGYAFTSRQETAQEHRDRHELAAAAAAAEREFRLTARFAEHDERLGATVSVTVQRETAPTRAEAEELVWPAILAETTRVLGEGPWQPSLTWLDVVELTEER